MSNNASFYSELYVTIPFNEADEALYDEYMDDVIEALRQYDLGGSIIRQYDLGDSIGPSTDGRCAKINWYSDYIPTRDVAFDGDWRREGDDCGALLRLIASLPVSRARLEVSAELGADGWVLRFDNGEWTEYPGHMIYEGEPPWE